MYFFIRKTKCEWQRFVMDKRYILNKEDKYAYITLSNGVKKTEQKEKATVFTFEEADAILKRAHKKLNGFVMLQLALSSMTSAEQPERNFTVVSRKIFSPEKRNDMYERTHGKCALCGKFVRFDQFTIDHIIPLAKGGTNELDNLQCICRCCNAMKQDFSKEEFMEKMIEVLAYQMKKKENRKYRKRVRKCCK